jgi:predicted acyltransferase
METQRPGRLLSLDAFRGLVILSMLIVNNIGDYSTTGYFWKHADWIEGSQAQTYRAWWSGDRRITQFPLLKHCTLADFVMPNFMLIIGIAIPFSSASRGRVIRRSVILVVLGWILCYFRDQFAPQLCGEKPFHVSLGMDVLQLLGVAYLLARVLYEAPMGGRIAAIIALFIWHWAVLRFWTQGPDVPRGTFTAEHNAISYIYAQPWWIWRSFEIGPRISMSWKGLMSVPPAAATMLLGTIIGDWIRRSDVAPQVKAARVALCGLMLAIAGFLWAFDLPFNKPRWSPAYLLYASGVGAIVLALFYTLIDIRNRRAWCVPLVVFGVNAIAAYFITILAKVLLLNTPRVQYGGTAMSLMNALLLTLKGSLGPWLGGWVFTIAFVTFWWLIFHLAYRRRIFWKL